MVVFLALVVFVYFCMYRFFFQFLPGWLRNLLNHVVVRKVVNGCVFTVAIGFLALGVVFAAEKMAPGIFKRNHHDNFEYIDNPLAVQKDIGMLFDKEEIGEEDTQNITKYLQKMHVRTDSDEKNITQEGLDYYCELIDGTYTGGSQPTQKQENTNVDNVQIRIKAERFQADGYQDYLEEASLWEQLFDESHLPSDLYQYSRALKDAVDVGYDMKPEEMLFVASEAISTSEDFLKYEDRNINGEKEIIINVEDIGVMNGKSYYQLAERSAIGSLKEWTDSFWMLSYACMNRSSNLIDESNKNYAKVHYYIGNICERMLERIANDNLYKKIGKQALSHYRLAKKALKRKKNYYNVEDQMQEHIKSGIKTVKGRLQ